MSKKLWLLLKVPQRNSFLFNGKILLPKEIITSVLCLEVMFEKDGEEQKTSYVVKLNQPNPMPVMEKMSAIMFEKEIGFYKEIVPLLNKELERLQFTPLGVPKYFHSDTQKEKDVIFMGDMR